MIHLAELIEHARLAGASGINILVVIKNDVQICIVRFITKGAVRNISESQITAIGLERLRDFLAAAKMDVDDAQRCKRWLETNTGSFRFELADFEAKGVLLTLENGYQVSIRLLPGPRSVLNMLGAIANY